MGQDTLSAIMEVEGEIQERLVAEQRQGGDMLCRLREELAEEVRMEQERLTAASVQAMADARTAAQERGSAMVREAEERVHRLEILDDALLERFILRHLSGILPEGDR